MRVKTDLTNDRCPVKASARDEGWMGGGWDERPLPSFKRISAAPSVRAPTHYRHTITDILGYTVAAASAAAVEEGNGLNLHANEGFFWGGIFRCCLRVSYFAAEGDDDDDERGSRRRTTIGREEWGLRCTGRVLVVIRQRRILW